MPFEKPLGVAHVHTVVAGTGGDRVSELEARYLAKNGHRVTVVSPVAPEIAARMRAGGIAIYDKAPAQRSAGETIRALGELDVVHCHCMVSAPFAAELARSSGAALVLHNHSMGEEWWECASWRSWLRPARRERRKQIDAAVQQAHRILCVSEPVVAHMRDLGLRTDQTLIVPNPIPDEYFGGTSEGSERYDVCVIARASRPKRPFTTLRILAQAKRISPGLRVVWVGKLGHWSVPVKTTAALFGLRSIDFRGVEPPAAVRSILDSSRVLLTASQREGQPLAVLEALARGCDVILSDILAHRASFSAIEGASFFSDDDIEAASRLLVTAVKSHARNPRPWLAAKHGLHVHGRQIEQAYGEALSVRDGSAISRIMRPPMAGGASGGSAAQDEACAAGASR